jgi:hypothetical protein
VADFHRPPAPCDGDEIGQRGGSAFRRPAQVERVLVLLAAGQAADQQELPRVRGGGQRPVAVAGAFLPLPARPPLEHRAGDCLVSADGRVPGEGNPVVAGDDDDVGERQCPQRAAELAAAAVDFVSGSPQHARPGRHQAFHLVDGQFRLGGERQVMRDAGLAAAAWVFGPALRHVHVEVGPRLPERSDQGGEHPGDAVLHLPGDTGVLRRHARGGAAFAQVSGLVDRQARADRVIAAGRQQACHGQRQQQPAQRLPRPGVPAEQGLHPVRPRVAGLLS